MLETRGSIFPLYRSFYQKFSRKEISKVSVSHTFKEKFEFIVGECAKITKYAAFYKKN